MTNYLKEKEEDVPLAKSVAFCLTLKTVGCDRVLLTFLTLFNQTGESTGTLEAGPFHFAE